MFNDEEGTVSVNHDDKIEWIPEWNNRSEDDRLTLVNLPMLVSSEFMLTYSRKSRETASTNLPKSCPVAPASLSRKSQ